MIDLDLLKNLSSKFSIYDSNEDLRIVTGIINKVDDDDKEKKICSIYAYKIKESKYNFLTLDDESGDLGLVANGIEVFIKEFNESYYDSFIILDKINVLDKFRSKGVGKWAIIKFIHNMTSTSDIVFLNPSPFEIKKPNKNDKDLVKEYDDQVELAQKRLTKFYKGFGFKEIKDTGILYFDCAFKIKMNRKLMGLVNA